MLSQISPDTYQLGPCLSKYVAIIDSPHSAPNTIAFQANILRRLLRSRRFRCEIAQVSKRFSDSLSGRVLACILALPVSRSCRFFVRKLFQDFSHPAVFPPEEQQRIAFPYDNILHFRDENGMISRFLHGLQPAFEIREGPVKYRSSVAGPVEARSGFRLSALVDPLWTRIVLGNRPLILAENIDTEALLGMQMSMGPGTVVDAYQYQHRIE